MPANIGLDRPIGNLPRLQPGAVTPAATKTAASTSEPTSQETGGNAAPADTFERASSNRRLFDAPSHLVRDTDGDGVGDMAERLAGSDPAAAAPNELEARLDGSADPRGVLEPTAGLERETSFDRGKGIPGGRSLEQALPADLDGSTVSGRNHFGVGSEKLLEGRLGGDLEATFTRDVREGGTPQAAPKEGKYRQDGPGSFREAGGGSSGSEVKKDAGGGGRALPPGVAPSGTNPARNMGLVGQNSTAEELKGLFTGGGQPAKPAAKEQIEAKKEALKSEGEKNAEAFEKWKKKEAGKMTDPDAVAGSTLAPSGPPPDPGNVDFVEGFGGGPAIEGDGPGLRYRDLVSDANPDAGLGELQTTTTDAPKVHQVIKPVDPGAGFDPGLPPKGGPVPGAGDNRP